MTNKRYYHVVTERPMKLNQVIIFDENHTNGVAKRIKKVAGLKKQIDRTDLDEMDNIILKDISKWNDISERELALEEVRKEFYNSYPSRMASLYVSQSLDDAYNWADYFINVGRKTLQIVLLECKGNSFTGDAKNCWYESPSKEESIIRAKNYWENKPNTQSEDPIYETIIDGEIKVVEILKDFRIE